jgi:hypothetical protein
MDRKLDNRSLCWGQTMNRRNSDAANSVDRCASIGGCCGIVASVVGAMIGWDTEGKAGWVGSAVVWVFLGLLTTCACAIGGAIVGHYLGGRGKGNGE